MSQPEKFLGRWSRRKREAGKESDQAPRKPDSQQSDNASNTEPAAKAAPAPTQATTSEAAEPVFDLSTLPSIDSITAETDITAFFAPGVPAELKLAAFRRAWVVDPKVRDFVGLADYDWDFHTPGALAGFGPLSMTDELRREVLRIVGELQVEGESVTSPAATSEAPATPSTASSASSATQTQLPKTAPGPDQLSASRNSSAQDQDELISFAASPQRDKVLVAMRQAPSGPDDLAIPARRSHGRALPK